MSAVQTDQTMWVMAVIQSNTVNGRGTVVLGASGETPTPILTVGTGTDKRGL